MNKSPKIYADRKEAGKVLVKLLLEYSGEDTVVLGLPRGGVVVAAEIARGLKCGLDILFAGKLRAPFNPELAIGAVTEDGAVYLNRAVLIGMHIKQEHIEKEKKERLESVKERLKLYRRVKEKVPLKDMTVIIADDGLATGSTMISAIQAVHASGAGKIIVAVPGGPEDTMEKIKSMDEVDDVVCPVIPAIFYAVGQLYIDFRQIEDYEVIGILKEFAGQAE
ncbi:MAG: phosphoribosyltransferase family protein [Deltaproteobacteria bacterium]